MTPSPWLEIQIKGRNKVKPTLDNIRQHMLEEAAERPVANNFILPLSTAEIPNSPPLGAIQPAVAQLGGTSIDPTMTVVPTPNAPACAESMTMYLTTPGMMAPANATGATATPGVSSPSGC